MSSRRSSKDFFGGDGLGDGARFAGDGGRRSGDGLRGGDAGLLCSAACIAACAPAAAILFIISCIASGELAFDAMAAKSGTGGKPGIGGMPAGIPGSGGMPAGIVGTGGGGSGSAGGGDGALATPPFGAGGGFAAKNLCFGS